MFEIYRFEDFQLNKKNRALFRQGRQLHLSQRAFEILLFLVERNGQIVTKESLLEEIWEDSFVEEGNLAVQMSALRNLLGEKRGEYKYIQTVTGKGYCFVANVERQEVEKLSLTTVKNTKNEDDLSIAVLPFLHRGNDETIEFLAEGITESLISNLSQLPQLKVMAHSAVARYKGKEVDLQESAFILGVSKILSGKIVKINETLVVSVELINAGDLTQIWGEQYEFQPEDLFKLKKEISHKIVESLKLKLTKTQTTNLDKQYTSSTTAYKLYLQGRYLMDKRTITDCFNAIEYFEKAIKIDSKFALAYTGIADAHIYLGIFYALSSDVIIPKAKSAIKTALSIDENLSEAYSSKGNLYLYYDFDIKIAESSLKRAIQLNPNNSMAYSRYSIALMGLTKFDESIEYQNKAIDLDPLSHTFNAALITRYYFMKDYAKAIAQTEDVKVLQSDFPYYHYYLAFSYIHLELFENAIEHINFAIKQHNNSEMMALKAYIYTCSGNKKVAREILSELESTSKKYHIDYMDIAHIYSALNEKDKAFEYLEKAREARMNHFCILRVDPRFDNLHSDPRFNEFLKKIGLPELSSIS